jgi:poly-gamma-glutamate synthesis protein (capsule biosynthesis protein)
MAIRTSKRRSPAWTSSESSTRERAPTLPPPAHRSSWSGTGVRYGFLQRSSVYWPTNHEARKDAAGIAVIRGHTAYHVPMFKTRVDVPPPNRPGIPPDIITWADAAYLGWFREDISALRPRVDVLVASCHWGLGKDVLQYMTDIAHAAIDAGADIVVGHGPHYSLPIEVYRGKPIFYGLGNFSFHTGHGGRKHGDWVGTAGPGGRGPGGDRAGHVPVRAHNDRNETVPCDMAKGRPTSWPTSSRAAHTVRHEARGRRQ